MRLYLRGRVYWGWYYEDGQRVSRSTGCHDKRAAETVVRRWEREAADPTHRAKNEATLVHALDRFIREREDRGRADGTLNMYGTKASQLQRVLGADFRLARLDANAVDGYVATRLKEGAARNTISKELTTLRGALKLAARRGEFDRTVDSVMPSGWSPEYVPRARFLTADEATKLLAAVRPERRGHVAFIIATSARWAESVAAQAGDIDLEAGTVRLRGTKTQEAARTVPIVGAARELLVGVSPPFAPWTNVRRDLHEACAAAGIEPVSPNDLRRTTATWLRQRGVEPHLIAAVLGHRDSRMVERVYGRMPVDALGAALRERLGE